MNPLGKNTQIDNQRDQIIIVDVNVIAVENRRQLFNKAL